MVTCYQYDHSAEQTAIKYKVPRQAEQAFRDVCIAIPPSLLTKKYLKCSHAYHLFKGKVPFPLKL